MQGQKYSEINVNVKCCNIIGTKQAQYIILSCYMLYFKITKFYKIIIQILIKY